MIFIEATRELDASNQNGKNRFCSRKFYERNYQHQELCIMHKHRPRCA